MGSRPADAAAARPRLLLLTPDFPPSRGGIQVLLARVAEGMRGLDTLVLAPDAPGAAAFDAASSLHVQRVRGGGRVRGGRNALLNAAALVAARRFRPELVLSGHIVTSPAAAAIKRASGALTVQYFYAEEIGAKQRLAAFAAREADLSIAISSYTASLLAAAGAEPRRLRIVPCGTDVAAAAEPLRAERPTVLTIARIEERYKGHDVMVRAFALVLAKVPDAQWVVIGDGSLRPAIEALARSYGVERSIRFLGSVSDAERDTWLRRAQLLAMPSRLPAGPFAGEGFGIVYLEAGAHGKPVLAGDVGGALDAVLDGETGLLVDPLDPLAVADAIVSLLLDDALAGRLGAGGRRRVEQQTWPSIAERVQRELLELLDSSAAPPPVGR
jgi:phosphatidylinositol alpha-1,6-mannosyltransferase